MYVSMYAVCSASFVLATQIKALVKVEIFLNKRFIIEAALILAIV